MNTHDDLITKYFESALSDQEREEFDALLHANAEFQAEVEFQNLVKTAITLNERASLKTQLQALEYDETRKVPKRVLFDWKTWLVAASVVLVMFSIYHFWPQKQSMQELFAAHFEVYPNLVAPIVRGEREDALKFRAFEAYDAADYDNAIKLFSELIALGETDYAFFYRGQAALASRKTDLALADFHKHLESNPSAFVVEAHWFLALCYLNLNDKNMAIKHLAIVQQNLGNPFQNQAAQLLTELQ
jgi:tetratricopeptide (TPR) repeat protein